jgi:hypothetical protein
MAGATSVLSRDQRAREGTRLPVTCRSRVPASATPDPRIAGIAGEAGQAYNARRELAAMRAGLNLPPAWWNELSGAELT